MLAPVKAPPPFQKLSELLCVSASHLQAAVRFLFYSQARGQCSDHCGPPSAGA